MIKITQSIKHYNPQRKDAKIEDCFHIIYKYLDHNPDKLNSFGQSEGLIEEILSEGLFKTLTLNKNSKQKVSNRKFKKMWIQNALAPCQR